jgi:hypothetical protein
VCGLRGLLWRVEDDMVLFGEGNALIAQTMTMQVFS